MNKVFTTTVTGIKDRPVTKRQLAALQESVGKNVLLKADRVLGVGRETVKLISVDVANGTAQVEVPEWGMETAALYMFVKLY
jgi:predicted ThiF/HesA family dinucleotide-utilizing enzyme